MPKSSKRRKRTGHTQYASAGAFEQQRLTQYITDVSNGVYPSGTPSFPSGYPSSPYAPAVPVSGGGGGVSDHIEMNINTTTSFSSPFNYSSIYQNVGTIFSWSGAAANKVYSSASGIFLFTVNMSLSVKTIQGAISVAFTVKSLGGSSLFFLSYQDRNPGTSATYPKTLTNTAVATRVAQPFYLEFTLVNSSTTLNNFSGLVTISKLGEA